MLTFGKLKHFRVPVCCPFDLLVLAEYDQTPVGNQVATSGSASLRALRATLKHRQLEQMTSNDFYV